MEAGAIILAGGKSSRMGTNKTLLRLNKRTNIMIEADQLKKYFATLIVVTNCPEDYSFLAASMVPDCFPGKGPLAGIHAGLIASPWEVNVVAAGDMPFLSGDLAVRMVRMIGDYDAVIPVIGGKRQPLFSVFKKRLAAAVGECLVQNRLRMTDVLDQLKVRYVTEEDFPTESNEHLERVFFNMNTPDDYERAKQWVEGEY